MTAPSPNPALPGRRLTVLLIEDDHADALLVEELIADANADIDMTLARTMAEAEKLLAAARPDCVLLDLNLPDANGIAAVDRVTATNDRVPIVVLTGLS